MKKIIILSTLLFVFFTSCKKTIESVESDLIAGETALKTVSNCEAAIIGAYASMAPDMDILLNSTFSDEVRTGEFYNAQTTHEWQYSPTDVTIRDQLTAINPLYRIVDRVNRVLAALPVAVEESATDAAKKSRLRGEALFLRAYALFDAYRFYGAKYSSTTLAMPYPEAVSLQPLARIQADAYFSKLYNDINAAKPLLPNALTDRNRAHLVAANGLLARVALYKEDWATAEVEASAFLNALPISNITTYPNVWTDATVGEVAFQVVRTPSVGARLGSIYRATSANATQIGTVTWQPSSKIWNAYSATDTRFSLFLRDEPLLSGSTPARPSRIVKKYAGGAYGTSTENIANVKLLRASEMLLIRAEARAELNNFTGVNGADADINMLRTNRITGYTNVLFTSKADAITQILDERFKELVFEGHRFWDLKRKGLGVSRLAADIVNTNSQNLSAGNFRFALPIPQPELNANPNIQQNPGYN
jgi:starch-binding outer membrane protein, SusD/RagB family